ncbi:MAG: hypothetical protein PHG61_02090 [Candidatus Marinimicrobia bacterium]|jgi:hypothetical protein|nr:hypothetical protein [Candidatus Neomarinimicrobiota bacterium]
MPIQCQHKPECQSKDEPSYEATYTTLAQVDKDCNCLTSDHTRIDPDTIICSECGEKGVIVP